MSPQEAVRHLIAARWSEMRIATQAGISQSTVNRLKHGEVSSVSYDKGVKLVALAQAVAADLANGIGDGGEAADRAA